MEAYTTILIQALAAYFDIFTQKAYYMAYYLFIALTPPASCELAEFYIDKALEWDETPEYRHWKENIDEGN